jgi:hypothetical protein
MSYLQLLERAAASFGPSEDLNAFLLGIAECHSNVTTHITGEFIEVYDEGRALGRKLNNMED